MSNQTVMTALCACSFGAVTVMIGVKPALSSTSKLMCSYGGVIQISNPAALTVMLP